MELKKEVMPLRLVALRSHCVYALFDLCRKKERSTFFKMSNTVLKLFINYAKAIQKFYLVGSI